MDAIIQAYQLKTISYLLNKSSLTYSAGSLKDIYLRELWQDLKLL